MKSSTNIRTSGEAGRVISIWMKSNERLLSPKGRIGAAREAERRNTSVVDGRRHRRFRVGSECKQRRRREYYYEKSLNFSFPYSFGCHFFVFPSFVRTHFLITRALLRFAVVAAIRALKNDESKAR